jgi:hypothetical protein
MQELGSFFASLCDHFSTKSEWSAHLKIQEIQ